MAVSEGAVSFDGTDPACIDGHQLFNVPECSLS
jgi:hypothetical protein